MHSWHVFERVCMCFSFFLIFQSPRWNRGSQKLQELFFHWTQNQSRFVLPLQCWLLLGFQTFCFFILVDLSWNLIIDVLIVDCFCVIQSSWNIAISKPIKQFHNVQIYSVLNTLNSPQIHTFNEPTFALKLAYVSWKHHPVLCFLLNITDIVPGYIRVTGMVLVLIPTTGGCVYKFHFEFLASAMVPFSICQYFCRASSDLFVCFLLLAPSQWETKVALRW